MKDMIRNKEEFVKGATGFFGIIFSTGLKAGMGEIEIRTFPKGRGASSNFFISEGNAAAWAGEVCNNGIDAYFGVNLRVNRGGRKENIHFLNAFHAEVDYGKDGHRKECRYETYPDALDSIQAFDPEPTILVHSGGGFHCYWVLEAPIPVEDYGIELLERINKNLSKRIGGDPGTQDISRVLRVPGTFNFKLPDNPREVILISNSREKYTFEDFADSAASEEPSKKSQVSTAVNRNPIPESEDAITSPIDISTLPVSDRIKKLILKGNDGTYPSRSEADMAVITALVNKGVEESDIKKIFQTFPIGGKYRGHPAPDKYLKHNIGQARTMSNLSEEEMADPLFITGALTKNNKGYNLHIIRLEEYMAKKYQMVMLDEERAIFRYNGKCYKQVTLKGLNKLCQNELGRHRDLFGRLSLGEFIHYAEGDILENSEKVQDNQLNYLTLQNGLYKIDEDILINHTPKIFTTNLLPYDYDPDAKCPRFIQYLDEIFLGDEEKIDFMQEAVGYIFHKSIPTPAIFFLVGDGSNGKSVFINTISNLVGEENTSNVSFNSLSDEYYTPELFQKMVNISGETPHGKQFNTDQIKAVTSGDWVTGREVYRTPMKFRPFAKHFLSMNQPPVIRDSSYGMWRRIWVINFPRKFESHEMDRQLESKLILELSGIFNWALEGYRRLKEKDFALTESTSMRLAKEEYRTSQNTVRSFMKENYILSRERNDRIKFSNLYGEYQGYCYNERIKDIESKASFKKTLEEMGFKIENSSKDNNQLFVFFINSL